METLNNHSENIKEKETGRATRSVDFKVAHNQSAEQLKQFIEIIDPKPGEVILDSMCGYGAVAKEILDFTKTKGFQPDIYLLDNSDLQLSAAKNNLKLTNDRVISSGVESTPFPQDTFDTVVMKMGLHELPKEKQVDALKEMFRVLKRGGKFVTWELALEDVSVQKIFQDIMRKKDELAGFDDLVANRYFQSHNEMISFLESAGFLDVRVRQTISSELSLRVREKELISKDRVDILARNGVITEQDEEYLSRIGKERCDMLISYVKEYMSQFSDEIKKKFKYREMEGDVYFTPEIEVFVGKK